jgi:two-component system sensor kinase FixL
LQAGLVKGGMGHFGFARELRNSGRNAVIIAFSVGMIAAIALWGWVSGNAALHSVLEGSIALQPTTAVALIVGALGITAAAYGLRRASLVAGAGLIAVSAVWLIAYVRGAPLDIDLMLFQDAVARQTPLPAWPGRPSLITCVVLLLFGISLVGVGTGSPAVRRAYMAFASVGALISALSLVPYLLRDNAQFTVLNKSLSIAINTAVAIGGLCAGVLMLFGDVGWVRVVGSASEEGRIVRLLAPVALVPVGFAFIANAGVQAGYYGPDVRMLLITGLSACALIVMTFWAARTLAGARVQRESLAEALELSAVVVCDLDGRVLHWSRGCEAAYGWTKSEAIGAPTAELFDTEPQARRDEIRAELERIGEWKGELRHRTREGELRWFATHWVIQSREPGPVRVVGTLNDVTDLKAAEASLLDSQERLRLALEAYDLGIADLDVASGQVIAEEGMERIFGVQPGELNAHIDKFASMLRFSEIDRWGPIEARLPQKFDEAGLVRPDGEVRALQGMRRFFYSPEGDHLRTIAIYRDVTEERRVQREVAIRGDRLSELRSELTHVSRLSAMGEMAAALAHELNQPLTAIGNSVGALRIMLGDADRPLDDVSRARVLRAAAQAEGQAVRAGEIVRRLRDFIARGEADARNEPLDELIGDAVALAAPNIKANQIAVHLSLSPKVRMVLADRIQVQQVLINLIRNATEVMADMPGPRMLTIGAAARRGMAEISVSDNGPGIRPEVAERLFSPFSSTKRDGMGVGLSICRRIIEAHGGTMWLHEAPTGGADFRFTLPLGAREVRHAH